MEAIRTDRAPAAIGPYSQAIRSGSLLFCSGQLPISVETGELIGEDIRDQTYAVLENLHNLLGAAGTDFSQVVKTTVYLADIRDFDGMNSVYAEIFENGSPARATVQVAALPKGALVEIDCIAALED